MRNKSGRFKKNNSLLALTIRKIKGNAKTENNSTKNTTNRLHARENNHSYGYSHQNLNTNVTKNNSNDINKIQNNKSLYSLIKNNNKFLKNIRHINIVNLKNKSIYNKTHNYYAENEKTNINETKQKTFDKNECNLTNFIYKKKNNKSINNSNNKSLNLNNITDIYNENINKSNLLRDQINSLNNKNQIMKSKLVIFLKLMRQYSNKITALINNNKNNGNASEVDLINTLSRLNKILNDPKLNKDVFEITQILLEDSFNKKNNSNEIEIKENSKENEINKLNHNIKENKDISSNETNIILTEINESHRDDNIIEINLNSNNLDNNNNDIYNICQKNNKKRELNEENNINEYNKDIEGLISKYEEKIQLLINENIVLKEYKNNQKTVHDNLLNENISLEKEVNILKEKLNEETDKNQELFSKYNYLSKTLIEFENKNKYLEKENLYLKKLLNDYTFNSNCIYKKSYKNNTNNNQKIKLIKNIEKIIKENNDINPDEEKLFKNKLNKSETQFYTSNILSYKDLGKDCNFFRKRNIGNIGTLRTEPNKFEKIQKMRQISSLKYLNNFPNINESMENESKEEQKWEDNINKKRQNSYDYFTKEKINTFHKNYSSNMIVPSKFFKHQNYQNLKKEIDNLDEEIIEIQSKIKEMLHN